MIIVMVVVMVVAMADTVITGIAMTNVFKRHRSQPIKIKSVQILRRERCVMIPTVVANDLQ